MDHAFLFEEGLWRAAGTFTDAEGRTQRAVGETRVRHEADRWILEGRMNVGGETPKAFSSRCEVVPFPSGAKATSWKSFNPDLGNLIGNFAVVDDALISTYRSEDGVLSGVECLMREDETTYSARGVLMRREAILSSWAVTLTRAE